MTQHALYLDFEYCTGCHSCELACRNELGLPVDGFGIKVLEDRPRKNPDGKWNWNYIAYPTELCNLCEQRTERGLLPSCVQTCQAKVLEYGTVEECAKKLVENGHQATIFIP